LRRFGLLLKPLSILLFYLNKIDNSLSNKPRRLHKCLHLYWFYCS